MSKSVVVVGGSGKVGSFVIPHLLEAGYKVRNVDRRLPEVDPGCPTALADARQGEQIARALTGAQAVVHLAAYPTVGGRPGSIILRDNVLMTYNVLHAASAQAVPRVVCMSTMAVIYYPHPSWYPFVPRYLPVDEDHPPTHRNPYSLSKQAGELAADMFSRLGRTVPVSLRPAWVVAPGEVRAKGLLDTQDLEDGLPGLWSCTDARDVARACRAAIEADLTSHEVFNLSAPDTFAPLPTCELVHRLWPDLADVRDALEGYRSLIDCRKAARVLCWEGLYPVRGEGG